MAVVGHLRIESLKLSKNQSMGGCWCGLIRVQGVGTRMKRITN